MFKQIFKHNYSKFAVCAMALITLFAIFNLSCIGQETGQEVNTSKIPLKILFGSPTKSNPQISADGKRLAYIAPDCNGIRNIWIETIGKNDAQPVTTQKERDIYNYCLSYDNKYAFYMQDNKGDENFHIFQINLETRDIKDLTPFENTRAGFLAYEKQLPDEILITMNKRDKKVFDAYKLNLKTYELTMIAQNPGNISVWIPDWNNNIRAARETREDGGFNGLLREDKNIEWHKIACWDLENGNSHLKGFSKDGKFIYATDSRNANTIRLVKIDTKTGTSEVVFEDPNYDFEGYIKDLETGDLLAGYYFKEKQEWVFFDKKFENDMQQAMKLDTGDVYLASRNSTDTKWIICFDKDNGPSNCWLFDRETKKGEFLFCSRPELKEYALSTMEPISFMSRDGLKINGYITYPLNKNLSNKVNEDLASPLDQRQLDMARKNLPTVLIAHGGPWGRDTWGYDPETQWLANLGYAVLQVNFRGSSGYGKNFLNAGDKEWGGKMQDDLTDAVNWAISNGITNPKKVAIFGFSFGGYAALAGAAFTPDLYCCAIDICGISNLVTFIKSRPAYWSAYATMYKKRVGDLEFEQDFLKSRSPFFSADKIKIPVMVVQGANDPRVKREGSDQIVEAMKKNGLTYEYLVFDDEGHGLQKEVNRMKFYEAAQKFLAKYLGI